MHYKIEKFRMEHFDKFEVRTHQRADFEALKANVKVRGAWEYELPIMTLFADEEPIFIFGIQNSGIGTYFPVLFASEGMDKHLFHVIRYVYDYVDKFVGNDVRRFEAYVDVTDIKAQRWAEFFGFENVGYRRQGTVDGHDQIIYERLWRK